MAANPFPLTLLALPLLATIHLCHLASPDLPFASFGLRDAPQPAKHFNASSIFAVVASLPDLATLHTAIIATDLEKSLPSGKEYTLFAPTNSAFQGVITNRLLTCVQDFYLAAPCSSVEELLSATNLEQLLLNHLVHGQFLLESFTRGERLQFVGDAVEQVPELGALIQTKQVTSQQLVDIFLKRLKKYNCVLEVVVSFTEKLAYEQAAAADDLLKQGTYLGPLHGIPYGLKDIIAVPGYRTTWGSISFKNQVIDEEAWVYRRLKEAGAVLIAKLVCGSLAYDDIWFGGRTRNPWNIEEFSTGSSAGPAAGTSAGLIPFAIGSETAGSITYPGARCGITAFRPTFGMVGRSWVMSLAESLDKLGPFCRSAIDCAIILDVIRGKDPGDPSSRNIHLKDPFSIDVTKLTVGYLEDGDREVVQVLASKGVKMVPINSNYTVKSAQYIINYTMDVEMLSHFDHWQRAGLDDAYEAQDQWPVEVRRARLVPAVDYIQAQRARGKLIREIWENLKGIDAFIGNVTDWEKVCVGNLVGMPVMVVPTGLKNITDPPQGGTRRRTTITTGIYGAPYHDSEVLALAMTYQEVTKHHLQRPPIDDLGQHDFHLNKTECSPVFGEV